MTLQSQWVEAPFQSFPTFGVSEVAAASHKVQLTTVHLLPSRTFLEGFLMRMLSGLGFFPGAGLFALESPPSVTVELPRRAGFLCVISDLSTLRNPLVTDSPLLSSEKTAPKPPAPLVAAAGAASVLISRTGGGPGGGGGGGGGAPPAGAGGAAGEAAL